MLMAVIAVPKWCFRTLVASVATLVGWFLGGTQTAHGQTPNAQLLGTNGDQLFVDGDGNANDIIISVDGDDIVVEIDALTPWRFDVADVRGINVEAYGSNDWIDCQIDDLDNTLVTGVTLSGSGGGDTVYGTDITGIGEQIFGGDGADSLDGRDGNDVVFGGDDNDTLRGGNGRDTIEAQLGDDDVDGSAGDDELYGGGGQDMMQGGDGADTIDSESGFDCVMGDAGNDEVYGGTENDSMYGGTGADTLFGETGDDVLYHATAATGVGPDNVADALWTGGQNNDVVVASTDDVDMVDGNPV